MNRASITVITLLLSIFVSQVSANETTFMSVQKYNQLKAESPEAADIYLSGVLSSYAIANALLEKRDQKKLYCVS